MAHVKSSTRTPASGWCGSAVEPSGPAVGGRDARAARSDRSAPSAGAGPRRPRPRLERNGEPARRTARPVGLADVDEEATRREVGVVDHVRHLVDRQHEQPAGLALGDQVGSGRRRGEPLDDVEDDGAVGRDVHRVAPLGVGEPGRSDVALGPLDESRPVRRVDRERRPQAVLAHDRRAAGDLLVARRDHAVPVEEVAVRRLQRRHHDRFLGRHDDVPGPAGAAAGRDERHRGLGRGERGLLEGEVAGRLVGGIVADAVQHREPAGRADREVGHRLGGTVAAEHDVDEPDAPVIVGPQPVQEPGRRRVGLERPDDDVDPRQGGGDLVPCRVARRVDGDAALAGVVDGVPVPAPPAQDVAPLVLDAHDRRTQLGELLTGEGRRLVAEVEHHDVLQERESVFPHRGDHRRDVTPGSGRTVSRERGLASTRWPTSGTRTWWSAGRRRRSTCRRGGPR